MTYKSIRLRLAIALALALFNSGCLFDSAPRSKAVLVVGSDELLLSEFADELALEMKKFDAIGAKNPINIKAAKDSILDRFLHDSLIKAWAKENSVELTTSELDTAVDEIRKQYPSDLAMKETLRQEHLSFESWKERLKLTLLQKKVFDFLKTKITPPTAEELRAYYDSNKDQFEQKPMIRLRQIVLDTPDDAERLFNQINKNTDLSELAKKFSVAPEASKGGDTGWIPKGTLEIFDKAFDWPVGKRSTVLKSPYGYHIFEVIGKRGETQLKFEDVRDSIQKLVTADREQAVYSAWLEEQIKKAKVLRNDDLINSVSIATKGEK